MLIDINAYVGHWPFRQLQYATCTGLLERMNKYGVDISVISNVNGMFYKNPQSANEELHAWLKADPKFKKRFIPFAVINPIYAGFKNDFKTCINDWGMKGVRIYPKYHDYNPTDDACVDLIKMCRDAGVPVCLTIRMEDSRERSWLDIDYVSGTKKPEWNIRNILPLMESVPDAQFMLLNYANKVKLSDDELNFIRGSKLLIDTSGRAITDMNAFIQEFGTDKIALGSHAPFLDYLTGYLRVASLDNNEISAEDRNRIFHGNAKAMIGL